MTGSTRPENPMLRVMSLRDFRLLFAGATTTFLGDQFALIATPWLVLRLTGDPLALGLILALEGIPRAVFMLLGGAITDRLSPRILMLVSDLIRLALTVWMASVVFTGAVQIWMLYVFGLGFGLVAGFSIPAENSMVPMLVAEGDLQAGNSIIMGVSQLTGFIGPTIAGIIIGGYSGSMFGIGIAFAVDAVSFAVSATALWLMHGGGRKQTGNSAAAEGVRASILAGMKYLWSDRGLRLMFLVVTALNFLIVGPLLVGIPVLANQRLPEGAVAFGLLMSAYAGGNLAGYLIAGSLPRASGRTMKIFVILLLAAFGLVVGSLGFLRSTGADFALMLLLGVGNGYLSIILFTWMQTRTPREMLGRMMSILMLSNTGLVPIAQAVSGAVSKWSLTGLFASAGALVLLLTLWTSFLPGLNDFCDSLATGTRDRSTDIRPGDEPSMG
jgi:MFS family permease